MRRALVLSLTAAAGSAGVVPAAQAAVSVDADGKRCYAEGDDILINGSGYTAGGPVRLSLERLGGGVLEQSESRAEQDGTVRAAYKVDDQTGWFAPTQSRFQMVMRLIDLTRLDSGRPQEDPEVEAGVSFIFSRWSVGVLTRGGRIHPTRRLLLNPVGFTNWIGKPLYAHWLRNGVRVHTLRLGTATSPCGDVRRRLARAFPFRPVLPGSYEVRVSPSPTDMRKTTLTLRAVRVKRTIR